MRLGGEITDWRWTGILVARTGSQCVISTTTSPFRRWMLMRIWDVPWRAVDNEGDVHYSN